MAALSSAALRCGVFKRFGGVRNIKPFLILLFRSAFTHKGQIPRTAQNV